MDGRTEVAGKEWRYVECTGRVERVGVQRYIHYDILYKLRVLLSTPIFQVINAMLIY